MKLRFPLYGKILLWFFLNLILIAGAFYLFVQAQFHFGLDSLVAGRAGDRVQAVADVIVAELRDSPREEWKDVLKRFSEAYQVEFYLFRTDGQQVVGQSVAVPMDLREKLFDRRLVPGQRFNMPDSAEGQPRFTQRGNVGEKGPRPEGFKLEPFRADGPRPDGGRPMIPGRDAGDVGPALGGATFPQTVAPYPKFMVRSRNPDRYWVGMRLPMGDRQARTPQPLLLVAVSDSLRGGGLFFDFTPWIFLAVGAVIGSVLLWLPLVHGITRSVSRMTAATGRIAEGEFEARVALNRSDELGSLAAAINQMASRLAGFVGGQKRFLGDIAHELCAPIARIQMALGIIEQRADESTKPYVADLREEVQEMSGLVNELLSFSKAGLRQKEIQLVPVALAELVRRVVAREDGDSGKVNVDVPSELGALAEPELLSRAIANLVRNALRHAGDAGPIVVAARTEGERVIVSVADSGTGVPESLLQQIFDPFFRLDTSRNRETGGAGLGLAIVKTCVAACQGMVTASNRSPTGLLVEITLKKS